MAGAWSHAALVSDRDRSINALVSSKGASRRGTCPLPRHGRLDSVVGNDLDGMSEAVLREAAMDYQITVNGTSRTVSARPDTPLPYALMNELNLKGPRYGRG